MLRKTPFHNLSLTQKTCFCVIVSNGCIEYEKTKDHDQVSLSYYQ